MSLHDPRLDRCGCCEPPAPGTPQTVANRPALDAVAYRVGTYASVRQSMLHLIPGLADELAGQARLSTPPLRRWTSREADDYGMALLDCWAVVADILTFYQERYANEAWLRTARRRASIRRLAALVGHRLDPGAAAATYLAYTLEDAARVRVPAGAQSQSVPKADDEIPQKFETAEALEAAAARNRLTLYPTPRPQQPPVAAAGEASTLTGDSPVPPADTRVIAFTDGGLTAEVRTVDEVTTRAGRPVLAWAQAWGHDAERAFVLRRRLRLFGHAAPARHVVSAPHEGSSQFLTWSTQETSFAHDGAELELAGTVDDLDAGTRLLVDTGDEVRLARVTAVATDTATVGPESGPATVVEVDTAVSGDRRRTVIYELGDAFDLEAWELPDGPIPPGSELCLTADEAAAVDEGRLLLIDDDTGAPLLARVAAVAAEAHSGGALTTLTLENPAGAGVPIDRDLDPATAHAHGNVVGASHGETVAEETLGDGDAAAARQAFELAKQPVTHLADPTAPGGLESSVEISVDGVRWQRRERLYGAGPRDRVYALEVDDEQAMTVRFGDGRVGARLPTGRDNVAATYRVGLGAAGAVDAGQITTALDRPKGVDAVTNPLPATGGVDPESLADARARAPAGVRTFDRAVSLSDFADLAREYPGVAKALAVWVWDGQERVVHLTLGGHDGQALGTALGDVRAFLDQRRDTTRGLRIDEYQPVPVTVEVAVEVAADHARDDVAAAVRDALAGRLAYPRQRFGQDVHRSEVYAAAHEVDGVVAAYVAVLDRRDAEPATARAHLPIATTRADPGGGTVHPAELAVLADAADLAVTATGGIT